MFASRPRFNDDPEPFIQYVDHRVHCPRPEFDRPQHNPTNGVLALFRKQRGPWAPLYAHIDGFRNGIRRLASEGFTIAEIEHADRVLRRLRNLIRSAAIEELLTLDYDTTDKEN